MDEANSEKNDNTPKNLPQAEEGKDEERKVEAQEGKKEAREELRTQVEHLKNLATEFYDAVERKRKEVLEVREAINSWNPFKTLQYGVNLRSAVYGDILPQISSIEDTFSWMSIETRHLLDGMHGTEEDLSRLETYSDEEVGAALALTHRQKEYLTQKLDMFIASSDRIAQLKKRVPIPFEDISSNSETIKWFDKWREEMHPTRIHESYKQYPKVYGGMYSNLSALRR